MSSSAAKKPAKENYPSLFAQYSDLFDKMLECGLILDINDFRILDANPVAERMLGQPRDRLLGQVLLDWVTAPDRETLERAFRIARRRYHSRSFYCTWSLPGGMQLLMEMAVCTLRLSDQTEVIQVLGKDITEAHEARRKVEQYLVELMQLNKTLETLSVTDELTQLTNFRHFQTRMNQEHERSVRYRKSYSVIFCDADHFKKYNDTHGHPAGDKILAEIADLLRKNCRIIDLPARYGGEEFAILCPETHHEGALVLAERIRKSVESAGNITLSIGVATYPEDGDSAALLLEHADEALYSAKKQGRNRVVSWNKIRGN